ncbi:cation acetate symporter, partial [Saccharothrix sp. MB29]|nr:cation acetate symporter [Saccharothrix sp. MB29]
SFDTATAFHVSETTPFSGTGVVDGQRVQGGGALAVGDHTVAAGSRLTFSEGSAVPHVRSIPSTTNEVWALPMRGGERFPL